MRVALTTAELASVISASAAAIAALGSWAAVRQTRKAARDATLPSLHGQVLVGQEGLLEVHIHNAGRGVAKGVLIGLVAEDSHVMGALGTGFLPGGESVFVQTGIPTPSIEHLAREKPKGVLICRDISENSYAWNLVGERKVLRRRYLPWQRHRVTSTSEALHRFYPEIDFAGLARVGLRVIPDPMRPADR